MGDGLGLDAWWDEPVYKAAQGTFELSILRRTARPSHGRRSPTQVELRSAFGASSGSRRVSGVPRGAGWTRTTPPGSTLTSDVIGSPSW